MNFFSELGQVSVAWRKTSSQPTGGVNSAPKKCSTYRVAQHITFQHAAWLKIKDCTSLCPSNTGHPRVMSHSLPHLTLTTSTSSLSPISSISHTFPLLLPFRRFRLHLKSAFRGHSRLQYRGQSLNVVFVLLRCCRGNADVLSSSLHSVRAGPGSVGRWRASPLLSHFSKNGSLGACDPDLAMRP